MKFPLRFDWTKFFPLTLLLLLAVVAAVPKGVSADSADAESRERGSITQVDLAQHPKFSQYWGIDSSARGYGKNACGLVAAAAALGGEDWTDLVQEIAQAAGSTYRPNLGIQPSNYVASLQEVFGTANVTEMNATTLSSIYEELQAGHIVIVNIKVSARTERPAASAPNYAHYARVLGIDFERDKIYIENTLSGSAYWTISLEEFQKVWEYPETSASMIPDWRNAEDVTRWAVILDAPAIAQSSSARVRD